MNNNYGKGNMVDAILKLLLSSENLNSLDSSLVSLFSEISEFDLLVNNIDHQETNPNMYANKNKKQNGTQEELLEKYHKAGIKLKTIQNLIKKSHQEMEKEKMNLVKVHEIYINKFKKKVTGSENNLDEKSKRILMESLMNSHNKSIMNIQKKKISNNGNIEKEEDIRENKSFKSISEKTEEVKKKFEKITPEKRDAIIKSLETRKKIMEL